VESSDGTNGSIESAADSSSQLRQYLRVLWFRKWSIGLVTGLVVVSALAFSSQQPRLYRSTAQVLVNQEVLLTQPGALRPNIVTEQQVMASDAVAIIAGQKLHETSSPADLLSGLSVQAVQNTEILIITYASPDPAVAQRRAQAFADGYLDFRHQQILGDQGGSATTLQASINDLTQQLDQTSAKLGVSVDPAQKAILDSQANVLVSRLAALQQRLSDLTSGDVTAGRVISPASQAYLSRTGRLKNLALALVLGALFAVGIAFLRDHLDDRLRGEEDLAAHAQAPVLGVIPRIRSGRGRKGRFACPLVTNGGPESSAVEAFRMLRTSLMVAISEHDVKTIQVTSAGPGEGKTVVTANLAVALARTGMRVMLVSADLHNPTLPLFFKRSGSTSLQAHIMAGELTPAGMWLPETLGPRDQQPGGREFSRPTTLDHWPGDNPESFFLESMKKLLAEWRESAEIVLIDTPPLLSVADSSSLARLTDGVLLVGDATQTKSTAMNRARRQLDRVNAVVIGAVLNRFGPDTSHPYPVPSLPEPTRNQGATSPIKRA
jgi:Mrp family chromosome partitioning ATPase/capsular polysaccharide biosynthesis protein